jgi:hypothetical protein
MISIQGTDFQTHELRGISPEFRRALRVWQLDAPEDRIFCSLHGKMEPISLYVPESIALKVDRLERDMMACAAMEQEVKDKVARDIEAARRR